MKDLVGQMVELSQTKKSSKEGRAIVLALREDIETGLKAGWSVKAIWGALRKSGRVTLCYEAFLRHVNKIIRTPKEVEMLKYGKEEVICKTSSPINFSIQSSPNSKELLK